MNKQQRRKEDKFKGRGLIESEMIKGQLENPNEADVDAEVNEMHGLYHL